MEPIRILIVDDHTVVRNGLKTFLLAYEDLQLVGEARNGEQAVSLCAQLEPDVVLMDLMMPGMDGVQATQAIRARQPAVQILALTSFKDEDLVQAAIQAGAIGYLLKDVSAEELATAIRGVCAGKPVLAPEAAQVLIQSARQASLAREHPGPGMDLTEREREVLALMVDGCNNQQIAAQLVISLSTAKAHVSNILSKLGVSSRTEAVSLALKGRLV